MIGFIAPYTFTTLGTKSNYSAIAIQHTLQFIVTHALGFSVFTSRILATDLSQSHCNFKSHMKSSCQSNSFLANSSQSPSTAIFRTRPNSNSSCVRSSLYSLKADQQRTPLPLLLRRRVTAPLHSNGIYSIVACVFVAAGMCLPSRCLEMGIHVTILF
jgi:hypothetical protein